MWPRRLLPWLFALTLLLGQATAFAHVLSHVQLDDSVGADPVCELCVAQAHLGHAAPPAPYALPLLAANLATPAAAIAPAVSLHPRHALARAPPASA